MKIDTKTLGILFVIAGILFLYGNLHTRYLNRIAKEKFSEEEYQGIINEIVYPEHGAFPYVRVNNDLLYFGMNEAKVRSYIKINDSIVKKSGTTGIIVYRRNLQGEWHEKVFK